jgi:hypothetical protein
MVSLELMSRVRKEAPFVAKRHTRPSAQYRYEHYDPR